MGGGGLLLSRVAMDTRWAEAEQLAAAAAHSLILYKQREPACCDK